MSQKLSVIITAYNQDEMTVVHARESMNCSRVPDEVIVINDGGDSSLEEKLATLDFKCRFVYARIDQDIPWNYNGACNLGVWLSTGNLLAFEDNDNVPTSNFYKEALDYLQSTPDVKRLTAKQRWVVSKEDMLNKPKDDWYVIDCIGPNQGTAIIYRDIYLQIKGHDERFCGRYGYMYYNFRSLLLNRLKIKFSSIGHYYYTTDGQSALSRSMSRENRIIYLHNARQNVIQAPIGILNFTYTFKVFKP